MSIAVLSAEYPDICEKMAELCDFVVKIQPNPYLPRPVACHADMNFLDFGDVLFAAGGNSDDSAIERYRKDVRLLKDPGNVYPDDVICNAKLVGERLFCNVRTISKEIIDYAEYHNYKLIPVKQGYTGCSVCKVTDNAIITSDTGIAKAANENQFDVLMIDNSEIILPGYNCGFIGGCTGLLDKYNLLSTGSLDSISDGNKIRKFCNDHNVNIIELSAGPMVDIGGILIFE